MAQIFMHILVSLLNALRSLLNITIDILNRASLRIKNFSSALLTKNSRLDGMSDWEDILSWNKYKNLSSFEVKVKHDLANHPFIIRNQTSDVETFRQVFIHQEYKFVVDKQPDVIVDAGANIGLASLYFASKYPDARIIAIEPEASNYDLLRRNAEPYTNIITLQSALWHEGGKVLISDSGGGHWAFVTSDIGGESEPEGSYGHEVRALTIPTLLKEHGLERIDILKMDIEGAEKEVFADSSGWIYKVTALIVELHERIKPGSNRSFYNGSNGFDNEWQHGENVYLVRGDYLKPA
ncbi:FkbM family methyltransferase [Thermodesulfobacteriota bacterium]